MTAAPWCLPKRISIHALLAESDGFCYAVFGGFAISIHALLAESDSPVPLDPTYIHDFYPRSPCGERRPWPARLASCFDFYPRSPCGERHTHPIGVLITVIISIHALLAESDSTQLSTQTPLSDFYPRSPCGERRKKKSSIAAVFPISIHALLAESDACA